MYVNRVVCFYLQEYVPNTTAATAAAASATTTATVQYWLFYVDVISLQYNIILLLIINMHLPTIRNVHRYRRRSALSGHRVSMIIRHHLTIFDRRFFLHTHCFYFGERKSTSSSLACATCSPQNCSFRKAHIICTLKKIL